MKSTPSRGFTRLGIDNRVAIAFVLVAVLIIYLAVFSGSSSSKPRYYVPSTGSTGDTTSKLRNGGSVQDTEGDDVGGEGKKIDSAKSLLNTPHGGTLVNLLVSDDRVEAIKSLVGTGIPSLTLSQRQLCDVELLINGGFSPLRGFMDKSTYERVLSDMRLGEKYNDLLFSMPITLDVKKEFADKVARGTKLALRDEYFNLLGILTVGDIWKPNKLYEASQAFNTTDVSHPAVEYLLNQAGEMYISGDIEAIQLPQHFDFPDLRRTPAQVREFVKSNGWNQFVAFQTRNPMHRAHIELTRIAADKVGAGVLIHPVVGMTKPGDVDYAVRVRCYEAVVQSGRYWKQNGVLLSLLPLAMRMAGPREALWHSIIRKNHGASYFIVGRDHAGCKSSDGKDFYGPYDAQILVAIYAEELGMNFIPLKELLYVPDTNSYVPEDAVPKGTKTLSISGTKFRAMMAAGDPIPPWFSDPDVIRILGEVSPPLHKRGFTVFFTGLSGSGKTTISHALIKRLQSIVPTRRMTILDGDVVRTHLSKELGFSIKDRNANVARIGFVAAEVTKHGGIAICVPIAPFERGRNDARKIISATDGGFVMIHVSTSAAECAARDVKGLYKKAANGEIDITGVSHPYEYPISPELTIDAEIVPVEDSVTMIVGWLTQKGYILKEVASKDESSIDLKASGVLTEGEVDSVKRHCPNNGNGYTSQPRGAGGENDDSLSLGQGFVSRIFIGTHPNVISNVVKEYSESHKAIERSVTTKHILEIEAIVVGTTTVQKATAGLEQVLPNLSDAADFAFTSGIPLTSYLNEDSQVEVAWKLWNEWHEGVRNANHQRPTKIAIANSRLLLLANTLLKQDPCAQVIAIEATSMERLKVINQIAESSKQKPEDVSNYMTAYSAAVKQLKSIFPERVTIVGVDSESAYKTILNTLP